MLLTIQETLNSVWENIRLWLPTIISVVIAGLTAVMQALIKKAISKESFTEVANTMIDKSIDRIGDVTYKVDIMPVIESKVKTYMEEVSKELDSKIETQTNEEKTTQQLLVYLLQIYSNSMLLDSTQKEEITKFIETLTNEKVEEETTTQAVEIKVGTTEKVEETTEVSVDR